MSNMSLWFRNWVRIGILSLIKKAMPWGRAPSYCWPNMPQMDLIPHHVGWYENMEKDYPAVVAGLWVGLLFCFVFLLPVLFTLNYSWPFTVPVCIRARTHSTGALSGISKITIFTALTFVPSSIILTVLKKETSKTVNSFLPLNMAF